MPGTAHEIAVSHLLHTLARAVDTRDWERWLGCFTHDATVDHTAAGGTAGSPQDVRDGLVSALAGIDLIRHHVTNIELEAVEPAAVQGNAYYLSPVRSQAGSPAVMVGGRYEFTARRHADGWLFDSFTAHIEWWT